MDDTWQTLQKLEDLALGLLSSQSQPPMHLPALSAGQLSFDFVSSLASGSQRMLVLLPRISFRALFIGLKVNPSCLSLLRFSIPSSGKPPSTPYCSFLHLSSGRYYLTLDQGFLVFKRVIHMFTQNIMRTPNEHLVHGEILMNERSRE